MLKHTIKIKTFSCDIKQVPGYFEADLVAHCGGNGDGQFLNTLVITDLYSQWTEFFPMLCKNSKEVISSLLAAKESLPYPILGLDTDNGSEFINKALLSFCKNHAIDIYKIKSLQQK